MPELPEVETIVRGLKKVLIYSKIIHIYKSKYNLRISYTKNFETELLDSKIINVYRLAKYIIIETDFGKSIIIHLGMSGRLLFQNSIYKKHQKHDHVVFHLSDNKSIIYNDPRRFGLVQFIKNSDIFQNKLFKDLGIEPFSKDLNYDYFISKIKNKNSSIKQFLMNNQNIVGIGNIYANEILHLAKISPFKSVKYLNTHNIKILIESIKIILNNAIIAGGSSLKDYIAPNGMLGNFQSYFKVYNRENKDCFNCKKGRIIKTTLCQRSTYYCIYCQKIN